MMLDRDHLQLGIVPGPSSTSEVEFSSDSCVFDIVELDPATVASALLSVPGVSPTSSEAATSWEWEAALSSNDAEMRFRMTFFEPDSRPRSWGGFSLHGLATVDEICRVADLLGSVLGSIRIHDGQCMMRTPSAFRDAAAAGSYGGQ